MHKLQIGLLALGLFAAIGASSATSAVPLDPGGPVTGFVPPAKGMLKCERYINKRVTLASQCTLKCHVKKADMIAKDLPFDDDFCEDTSPRSCQAKYNESLGLQNQSLCPSCLDVPTEQSLYSEYRDVAEMLNAEIYCDDTESVPFGDDDTGFVSLNHDISKCEDNFARNVFKLIKCLNLRCHRNFVDDLFFGTPPFNNAACEDTDPIQSCQARFEAANLKIVGCPPCLDAAHRAQVFLDIQQALDSRNGLVYCAQ